MPIRKSPAVSVAPAVMADEFIICGFQGRERDYTTGDNMGHTEQVLDAAGQAAKNPDGSFRIRFVPTPTLSIYWVKKLNGKGVERGVEHVPAAEVGGLMVDGSLTLRSNIKNQVYALLQAKGVFPTGVVS